MNLQDTRTKSEYRRYCEVGFRNQEKVLQRLKEEYNWSGRLLKKERFEMDFAQPYQPDARVEGALCEIKTSTSPVPEFIDIKQHQVETCAREGWLILYANPTGFGIIDARLIVNRWSPPIFSKRINKMCYRIPYQEFKWRSWTKRLELEK